MGGCLRHRSTSASSGRGVPCRPTRTGASITRARAANKEAGVVSLREQVGDEDEGRRHGQRSHGLAGAERADRAVARATAARGLPVDLKNAIEEDRKGGV